MQIIRFFSGLLLMASFSLQGEASIGDYYATCPKKCGFNFNPVCGSNGKSYLNECRLQAAACQLENGQIVLVHKGRCSDCGYSMCIDDYQPVCGSDGKTYKSPCILRKASCYDATITMVRKGECEKRRTTERPQFITTHRRHQSETSMVSDGNDFSLRLERDKLRYSPSDSDERRSSKGNNCQGRPNYQRDVCKTNQDCKKFYPGYHNCIRSEPRIPNSRKVCCEFPA